MTVEGCLQDFSIGTNALFGDAVFLLDLVDGLVQRRHRLLCLLLSRADADGEPRNFVLELASHLAKGARNMPGVLPLAHALGAHNLATLFAVGVEFGARVFLAGCGGRMQGDLLMMTRGFRPLVHHRARSPQIFPTLNAVHGGILSVAGVAFDHLCCLGKGVDEGVASQ